MSDRTFERAVRDWLDDGSDRTPRPAIDAVLLAVKTTPQERGLGIPRRFNLMPTYMRLAAVAAVVAVAGVGALTYLGPGGPGGPSTPPPTATTAPTVARTPTPTASLAAGTITSPLYGYTVTRPEGWTFTPSAVEWENVRAAPAFDTFAAPVSQGDEYDDVHIAAQPIPDGMTTEDWLLAYAESQEASTRDCKGAADDWTDDAVGSLQVRVLELQCTGEGFDVRVLDVAFVIESTGYVMSGNPTVIRQFLEEFEPGT